MFFLPLRPSETVRAPLFATALVAANLIVFLAGSLIGSHVTKRVGQNDVHRTARQLSAILMDAESGLSEGDRSLLEDAIETKPFPSEKLVDLFRGVQAGAPALSPKSRYQWDLIYPVFESYSRSATARSPGSTDWTFSPENDWFPGIVTHQFLHDGWLHLLVNLLFLWVAACIAEEVLGAHVLWVYVAGGVAAALAQVQAGIPAGGSLVGASGAISALMGLCLVSRPKAKVKLFYFVVPFVLKYGVFDCPLWFFLPVWLITQLFFASIANVGSASHVAYAAHIGGFVFGCLVGLAWTFTGASSATPKPSISK